MKDTEAKQETICRSQQGKDWFLEADICIVGSGMAGLYAAMASAELGRRVILMDAETQLGGMAYNANIGAFCGFFSNGKDAESCRPLTRIYAEEMMEELRAAGGLFPRYSSETLVPTYNDLCFLRWAEHKMQSMGVQVLLGCTVSEVQREGRRIRSLTAVNRYGKVHVQAKGFVDASGDAALAWAADLPCRKSEIEVLGSQVFLLKEVNCENPPSKEEISQRAAETAEQYGLERLKGVFFYLPNEGGMAYVNMTHVPTPMDPVEASRITMKGKDMVDRVVTFLQKEFPETFGRSCIQKYGETGIRQTRSVAAVHQLTAQEIEDAVCFPDRVARCSWPIELHNESSGYVWKVFPYDHVHYIPLSSMISPEADNYAAAGRCIDADVTALSSVRVMGPCAATGVAAAHALDLAGDGSVHQIDLAELRKRLERNLL